MKKILTLIAILGLIGILIGCSTSTGSSKIITTNASLEKDRLQTIQKKGVLTFASANDPPFVYINPKTNQLDGVDANIITEIAKRLGINNV